MRISFTDQSKSVTYLFSISIMTYTSVPYPVSGPPGVRHLLAIRGVSGFFGTSIPGPRYYLHLAKPAGLFGIYYSLQYLSLSDAITITFLVPTTTAIAGYFLLGEALSRKEVIAGSECTMYQTNFFLKLADSALICWCGSDRKTGISVWFPKSSIRFSRWGRFTPSRERNKCAEACGCWVSYVLVKLKKHILRDHSVALLGVLGGTGACTFSVLITLECGTNISL